MNLLHPTMLLAGFAVLLPFVIHWLTKPKPRRMPLSTIRFVMQAVQQRRARHRLRDLMILMLRGAAVALLAWAFARPLIGAKPLIAPGGDGDAVRVVIIDQSMSMGAVERGITPFERARTIASQHLSFERGLQANLILAGARPRAVFESLSSNFGALREALARAQPLSERLNLSDAIAAAAHLLAPTSESDQRRRELVIVSDFQRSNWASADFAPLPKQTVIQFESVAPEQTPANLAILRVGSQGRLEQGREVRLEVDVGNFSPTPRDVQVELNVGDQTYRLSGLCLPGVKSTLTTDIVLRARGWQSGQARLIGTEDALAADNARSFVLDVRPTAVYGLITREPSRPAPTSSHFLERALSPLKPREGAGERVVRIDPAQLDREALVSLSLIVLDHPGRLSPENIDLLAGLVRRGRGLLYIAAEPIDAANLKLLAGAVGSDLRMPVQFIPAPAGQVRKDLFLAEWRAEQVPFKALDESMGAAVGSLRFSGGLASLRAEEGLIDDVLATYSDRSASLVVTPCGAGMVAVLNVDLSQSNLVGSGIFVPLISELVGRLLAQRRGDDALPCGEPLAIYLPPDAGAAAGLTIASPAGARAAAELGLLSEESSFVMWRASAAGPPGIYQVMRDGMSIFAVATAAPAVESELGTLDANVLKTRLTGGRTVYFRGAASDPDQKDDAWAWILAACCACMIAELTALKLFRT